MLSPEVSVQKIHDLTCDSRLLRIFVAYGKMHDVVAVALYGYLARNGTV